MNNLFFLFILVPLLAFILLALNVLFSQHKPDEAKISAYECGFSPVPGQTRNKTFISFLTVGLFFVVFDVELILLYPIALTLYEVEMYGFSTGMVFFSVLTIGFILEIGSGALNLINKNYEKRNVKIIKKEMKKSNLILIQDSFRNVLIFIKTTLYSNVLVKSLNQLVSDRKIILSYKLIVILFMVSLICVLIITFTLNGDSNSDLVDLSTSLISFLNKARNNLNNQKKKMIKGFKQQLAIFFKSRSIFSGFLFNNLYFFFSLIIFVIITFLFNIFKSSFQNINFYDFNFLNFVLYGVILYFIYIKFTLLVRIVSLIRSVKFFYLIFKSKEIKDIKLIALYYYSFNGLFFIFSILFIYNLNYNLKVINIQNYTDYTDFISLALFLLFLKPIFNKNFKILDHNTNTLYIIFSLLVIFFPFVLCNFYPNLIKTGLEAITIIFKSGLIPIPAIHCASGLGDENNFTSRPVNFIPTIHCASGSEDVNNFPSRPVSDAKIQPSYILPQENIFITKPEYINKDFFKYFKIKWDISNPNDQDINNLYNIFMKQPNINYNLDKITRTFVMEYIEILLDDKYNKKPNYIDKLFKCHQEHTARVENLKLENLGTLHDWLEYLKINDPAKYYLKESLIKAFNKSLFNKLVVLEFIKEEKKSMILNEIVNKDKDRLLVAAFNTLKKKVSLNNLGNTNYEQQQDLELNKYLENQANKLVGKKYDPKVISLKEAVRHKLEMEKALAILEKSKNLQEQGNQDTNNNKGKEKQILDTNNNKEKQTMKQLLDTNKKIGKQILKQIIEKNKEKQITELMQNTNNNKGKQKMESLPETFNFSIYEDYSDIFTLPKKQKTIEYKEIITPPKD